MLCWSQVVCGACLRTPQNNSPGHTLLCYPRFTGEGMEAREVTSLVQRHTEPGWNPRAYPVFTVLGFKGAYTRNP